MYIAYLSKSQTFLHTIECVLTTDKFNNGNKERNRNIIIPINIRQNNIKRIERKVRFSVQALYCVPLQSNLFLILSDINRM